MKQRKFIYICSPLRGDIERNVNKAIGYCIFAYTKGGVPLAPHTIFTRFLDDSIQEERDAGIAMGIELLFKCDEIWTFGNKITEGMEAEMAAAKTWGIKVRRFDDKCEALGEQ